MELHFWKDRTLFDPRLVEILGNIAYKPTASIALDYYTLVAPEIPHIIPMLDLPDVETGEILTLKSSYIRPNPGISERDLVQKVFRVFLNLERHEVAEQFQYRGFRVNNPHISRAARRELWFRALNRSVLATDLHKSRIA